MKNIMSFLNIRYRIIFVMIIGAFLLLQYHSTELSHLLASTDGSYIIESCSNLDETATIASKGIMNNRVAIVLAIDSPTNALDYAPAMNTTQCYANHYGYPMVVLNLSDINVVKDCPHSDVFFKRHCAVYKWLESKTSEIDYILYIDADMGVINPCHTIQEYFDDTAELIFYDRFYDFEIAAGSYIVKNTNFSRQFLKYWADYNFKLPKSFHGTDNGAVHQVFMEYNFLETSKQLACYSLWNKSQGYDDLFAFQACTQAKLGLNRTKFASDKIKLIRKKSIGWVRDGWLTGTSWAPRDFMMHGWKMSKLGGEWKWPFYQTTFDLETCQTQSLLRTFLYNANYVQSNTVINAELEEWRIRVDEKMNNVLKTIDIKM